MGLPSRVLRREQTNIEKSLQVLLQKDLQRLFHRDRLRWQFDYRIIVNLKKLYVRHAAILYEHAFLVRRKPSIL